ncbi:MULTISPECIES: glycine--tRNA ligase subunit beta [Sphingobium]|uniref:glycine--tRNA ligase subunit beta n=1 Tax=Sphingobium TaxID=165695 RepID=UPI0015EC7B63|nr:MULTISPECIES: glycine--tRNA ligase subunit beta [Sphingobium]MCW2361850.1 glycyl-tRNA synthetase beta chain [Sphingobium sp. B10D3B]MCW2401471.1 glycyl-tRNA synthetase beta chain [Sphingobium sp. B10D7B]MCW2408451.1 glycyl-tRNA synthetase beta chain [Sphingobium xanthum]
MMSADFLLELRCEEIPARMQAKASEDFARLFSDALAQAGLKPEGLTVHVTPRRLALIARALPLSTQAVSEEFKGPRTSAPPQALEGFLRKTGLTQDQLEDRDGVWFATVEKPGRATADVLAEAIPQLVRAFPWPKSMRWGDASLSTESLRWVRPLQGIIALLGNDVVSFAIEGIATGRTTRGHRFHSSGEITIESAATYADQLRAAYVIVDQEERKAIIDRRANELATQAGLELIPDAGLVAENAGLTEWPVPLLGRFDAAFLEVPPEVIQLTLRINQKYFVLRDSAGKLANAFICTANIEAIDGGTAIVEGNGKVLAARLSDARFFWEQDKKTKLEDHAKKLSRITFHEKLGTVADKVERVAKLARWLVEEGIVRADNQPGVPAKAGTQGDVAQAGPGLLPSQEHSKAQLADLAEQAARLCKADLVTEMVGEFPELQGLMGGYYARAEGLPDAVADAIRDHYKPVGQGDEVPTAPVTVAVSLADKLDTLVCFFAIDEKPTGSKDPFALRRAALGSIRLVLGNQIRGSLTIALLSASYNWYLQARSSERRSAFAEAYFGLESALGKPATFQQVVAFAEARLGVDDRQAAPGHRATRELLEFTADRLKVQQREAGVRHDLIDAVFALGGEDDIVRLLARVHALQSFVSTEDGKNLLAGYKRAANILKKEQPEGGKPQSQLGEEDPGEALTDPEMADAMRAHEAQFAAEPGYALEPAEAVLVNALDEAEPRAQAAIEAEDFESAMAALATLRAPIDAFFETVTVNDADPVKRQSRLSLLTRIRAAVHKVADFSKIEG